MQNTCPYGWAAKTSFVSSYASHCPHCPMKEGHQSTESDTRNDVKKDLPNTHHLFVIYIGRLDSAYQILAPIKHAPTVQSDDFKDVYLDPLLRPPAAFHNSSKYE
jgi:hypothetical protein